MRHPGNPASAYKSRYRGWMNFQVLLPICVLTLLSLAAELLGNNSSNLKIAAIKVLGGCDLILFTALILLGVSSEFESYRELRDNDGPALGPLLSIAHLIGVLGLMVFALVQSDIASGCLIDPNNNNDITHKGLIFSLSSVAFTLLGLAIARTCYIRAIILIGVARDDIDRFLSAFSYLLGIFRSRNYR